MKVWDGAGRLAFVVGGAADNISAENDFSGNISDDARVFMRGGTGGGAGGIPVKNLFHENVSMEHADAVSSDSFIPASGGAADNISTENDFSGNISGDAPDSAGGAAGFRPGLAYSLRTGASADLAADEVPAEWRADHFILEFGSGGAPSVVTAPPAPQRSRPQRPAALRSLAPAGGLRFSGIGLKNGVLSFGAEWDSAQGLPGGALDLFGSVDLRLWRWMARFAAPSVAAGAADFELSRANLLSVPPHPQRAADAAHGIYDLMFAENEPIISSINYHTNPPFSGDVLLDSALPPGYAPGAVWEHTNYAHSAAPRGFFRLGTLLDSDEDGLTDAYEALTSRSDSADQDTDGDGLADGLEVERGADPLNADTDEDGLTDYEESVLRTDPLSVDTDGDGLADMAETGAIRTAMDGAERWFDTSGGRVLNASPADLDDGAAEAALPFAVSVNGMTTARVSANANGIAGLFTGAESLGSGWHSNGDISRAYMPEGCALMVAGFWDDLRLFPAMGSEMIFADVRANGSRFAVLEYRNMGFRSRGADTNNTVSFQIVFEEGRPDRLSVLYKDARGLGAGGGATLGAAARGCALLHSYNSASALGGLCISYILGAGTDPLAWDSDFDGLGDGEEAAIWTNPLDWDTDNDWLGDSEEVALGTDPLNEDTDDDGLNDRWEQRYMPEFDPLNPSDGLSDNDGDGLSFGYETNISHTEPNDWDSDGDGLSDGVEIQNGTDPWAWDSDYDGMSDGDEADAGTDPSDADTDGDGLDDGWEEARGAFDPFDPSDGAADWDGDGLSNAEEITWYETDWLSADTDGDGLGDGDETDYYHGVNTNPLRADSDDDGLDDSDEIRLGANPNRWDTDHDGCPDGWEAEHGFDPLDASTPAEHHDTDGDRIDDIREAALGTNPRMRDTDGDGLEDAQEAGWISAWPAAALADDGSNSVDVLTLVSDMDSGSATLPLPFPVEIQGVECSNITVFVDGRVALGRTAAQSGGLEGVRLELDAFSDDLRPGFAFNSALTMFTAATNGARWCVISYANMEFTSRGVSTDNMVSFQVAFAEGRADFAAVSFQDARGYGDGRYAVLEARPARGALPYSRNEPSVYPGFGLAYHIGIGTGAALADTDADGVADAREYALGTSPFDWDSDGDILPDGAEISAGLDPLGADDTDADADADGLDLGREIDFGTDPENADTDGDGAADGAEMRQGSDPLDPQDSAPREVVPAEFFFGDESSGHSEKYRLVITPVSGDTRPAWAFSNREFGRPDSCEAMLAPNAVYDISLEHVGTNIGHGAPDYDYTLEILSSPESSGLAVMLFDPDEITGWHEESDYFYAKGKSARITTAVVWLAPDRNRDGAIDGSDRSAAPFRLWLNDDLDSGDWNAGSADIPGPWRWWRNLSGNNSHDGSVNGRGDLADFFPVRLDIGNALEVLSTNFPGGEIKVRLKQASGALNFLCTELTAAAAGSFLTAAEPDYSAAAVKRITRGGSYLPAYFLNAVRSDPDKGVILVEAREAYSEPIVMEIIYDGEVVCLAEMAVSLSGVEEMFRFHNLRADPALASRPREPRNLPDAELGNIDVFMAHGFLVPEEESRAWGSEFFKRLWREGSRARFHNVTWSSDAETSASYESNVNNAFLTDPAYAALVNSVKAARGSSVIVMAHSLGNMLTSAAIQDCGMAADKYFALNGAVAAEAYDASVANVNTGIANQFLHEYWRGYEPRAWAANWHLLFTNAVAFPDDDRAKLTWRGRFASAAPALYNFWSAGDEVLEIGSSSDINLLTGIESDWEWWLPSFSLNARRYIWHKQALFKGRNSIYGTRWAGWGFWEHRDPEEGKVYSIPEANSLSDSVLRNAPVFRHHPPGMFNARITPALQNEILARGIPEMSKPIGADTVGIFNSFGGQNETRNFNMHTDFRRDDGLWPQRDVDFSDNGKFPKRWLHTDLMNLPHFYTHKLYEEIVKQGNMK